MKHKKFYLAISLLLGSFFTITNLSGCGEVTETQNFTIEGQINIVEAGTLTFDKTSGTVGEKVKVTINVNEGYKIISVTVNGEARKDLSTSFEMTPKSGENTVKVEFEKEQGTIPDVPTEDKYQIELDYDNKLGTVGANKLQGNVGEKVTLVITPNEDVIIEKILINGAEVDISTREFTPIKGKNIVKVIFKGKDPVVEPEKDKFTISIEYDSSLGKATVDKNEGEVGEKVTLTIESKPGYGIKSIKINGKDVDISTREFEPIKGQNNIVITFEKLEEPKEAWTIEVISGEGGKASVNKINGVVGEEVILEINADPDYAIETIKFNGEEVDKEIRKFTPIKGENTIEVTFKLIVVTPGIDDGFSIDLHNDPIGQSDINTNYELMDALLSAGEIFIQEALLNVDEVKTIALEKLEQYPAILSYVKRTNLTKQEFSDLGSNIINKQMVELFFPQENQNYTLEERIKLIIPFLKNAVNSLTLHQFNSFLSLGFYSAFVFSVSSNVQATPQNNALTTIASPEEALTIAKSHPNQEVKEFAKGIKDSSEVKELDFNKIYSEENMLQFKVLGEFIYKLFKGILNETQNTETISNHIITVINLMNSNGNLEINDYTPYKDAINFLGTILSDRFVSLDGFKKMIESIGIIDSFNTSIFSDVITASNRNMGLLYTDISAVIKKNLTKPEDLYRLIKFVGEILKDVSLSETEFLLNLIFGKATNITALSSINFSKVFIKTYTRLGNDALLVKNGINSAMAQLSTILKVTSIPVVTVNSNQLCSSIFGPYSPQETSLSFKELEIDKIIKEIENSAKKDTTNLTAEDDEYYQKFISDNIVSKITYEGTQKEMFDFQFNTSYSVGDKLNLVLRQQIDGTLKETIIDDSKVQGFNTSTRGFKYLTYKLNDLITVSLPYTVGISTERLIIDSYEIEMTTDLTTINIKNNKSEVVGTADKLIGLDLTKKGFQKVAFKYNEEFFFINILVYKNEDVRRLCKYHYDLPIKTEFNIKDLLDRESYKVFEEKSYVLVNGKFHELSSGEVVRYEFLETVAVNGRYNPANMAYSFFNEGSSTLDIEFKTADGSQLTAKFLFNHYKVKDYKTSVTQFGTYYFNYKGATRFDSEWMSFGVHESFYLSNYNVFSYYTEEKSSSLSFKNGLKNDTLSKEEFDIQDGYYFRGEYIPFNYTVYELVEEKLDSLIFTSMLKENEGEYTYSSNLNYGNIYIYKKLNNNLAIDVSEKSYSPSGDPVRFKSTFDTTKTGLNKQQIEILVGENPEQQEVYYYVSELLDEYDSIKLNKPLSIGFNYLDDDEFKCFISHDLIYYDPFSANKFIESNDAKMSTILYKDIKNYLDFEENTHEVLIEYNGKTYHLFYETTSRIEVSKGEQTIDNSYYYAIRINEAGVYKFTYPNDVHYSFNDFDNVKVLSNSNGVAYVYFTKKGIYEFSLYDGGKTLSIEVVENVESIPVDFKVEFNNFIYNKTTNEIEKGYIRIYAGYDEIYFLDLNDLNVKNIIYNEEYDTLSFTCTIEGKEYTFTIDNFSTNL